MNSETALITGASSGIAYHLAHEFAGHGYSVVLVAPVETELQAVAATPATAFKGARADRVDDLLETLASLGQAHTLPDGTFVAQ